MLSIVIIIVVIIMLFHTQEYRVLCDAKVSLGQRDDLLQSYVTAA